MSTQVFDANGTWTCNLTDYVMVEVWGPGGGGASTSLTTTAGGGGGGGAYTRQDLFLATSGVGYTVVAPPGGAGGPAGNSNGSNGANAHFHNNAILAGGGIAGLRTNAAGAGNDTHAGGSANYAGGAGAAGVNATHIGGGGGAGAGNSAVGAAASGINRGAAANGAGAGGNGGPSATAGNTADNPGGGGGGSGNNTGTAHAGGAGGNARVIVTYNDPVTASGKVTNGGANQANAKVFVSVCTDADAANPRLVGVANTDANGNWSMVVPGNRFIHASAQWRDANNNKFRALPCAYVLS